MSALEAILATVSAEYREPLVAKNSAKEAWKAIAAVRVGSEHAKKVSAQLLNVVEPPEIAYLRRRSSYTRH